jgi:Flp pilus assembly protein TadB
MAQTKRKRRTKHRGTAAGTIQARGRTGRPLPADEKKKQTRAQAREQRLNTPPTWKSAVITGVLASAGLFLVFALIGSNGKHSIESALLLALFALVLYIPGGYYMQLMAYRRRQKRKQQAPK